jgi:predicted HAD superfamily phosphohydrolase YqeG
MELLGAGKKETAVIGDQLFTDILCGRLAGLVPILVEPMEPEPFLFFKMKRFLEKRLLYRCNIPFETGKDRKEA